MFFIQGDITVETNLNLPVISAAISRALNIPEMRVDESGKYEDVIVYVSSCFGLEFGIGRTDDDPPDTFHLFFNSDTDAFDFDGSEKEVDGTEYVLLLLKEAGIKASRRDPGLLYPE